MPIEPFQCPDEPPADYPKGFPAMDVINHWNPDETDKVPETHYLSTCRCFTKFTIVQFSYMHEEFFPFFLLKNI